MPAMPGEREYDVILFDRYEPKYMPASGNFIWFGAVAPGRLTPLAPTRILDTRSTSAVNYAGAKPGAASTTRAAARPKASAQSRGTSRTPTAYAIAGLVVRLDRGRRSAPRAV